MEHTMPKICLCGSKIEPRYYEARPKTAYIPKYCSRKCAYSLRVRPNGLDYKIVKENKGWFKNKGGGLSSKGYRKIHLGRGKYKTEHRIVLEKHLRRPLLPNEVVHHLNGNKLDNRVENLQIMTKKEHDLLHNGRGIKNLCQR